MLQSERQLWGAAEEKLGGRSSAQQLCMAGDDGITAVRMCMVGVGGYQGLARSQRA